MGLVVAKIWNKNLSGFWIYNYQGTSSGSSSAIFGGSSYALSQTSQGDPTIIASQIPVGAWYEAIADQTIADAIMDRIIHVGQLKFNWKDNLWEKEKIYERKEKQKKERNHLQCKDIISIFAK